MKILTRIFGKWLPVLPIMLMAVPAIAQPDPWPVMTNTAKPWARWWWMGNAADERNLAELMETYSEAGIGGLEIAPVYGAVGFEDRYLSYLSEAWMNRLRFTVEQGQRLGLGIDLTGGTGWPFGGPQVTVSDAASKLVYRTFMLKHGEGVKGPVRPEDPKDEGAKLMELVAYDPEGRGTVLTGKVAANGTLTWKAPADGWRLYAVFLGKTGQQVKRAAPGGKGFTLDHFSPGALDRYLARFDSAFAGRPPGVRAFYNDSYEVYGADWTEGLFDEFRKRRGYDVRLHLPELLGDEGGPKAARVKSDYRETLSELLLEYFTERWTAWAHRHGAITKNQAHGSPGNLLDLYAAVDIPEMETFGASDFPIPGFKPAIKPERGDQPDPVLMKFAASAAHLTGRKLVSSETFTWLGEHFRTSLAQCKPEVEQCFLSGINHVFYHGITYSPKEAGWPGWLFYASMNFVPNNSWWPHLKGLNAYISRVQSVLQDARVDNELLLYWPVYDLWDDPKGRMKTFTVHNVEEWLHGSPFYEAVRQLEAGGYGVDFISDRLISQLRAVDGGLQTAGGQAYKALLVPSTRRMPLETLEALVTLAGKGVPVIFQAWPEDVPGFGDLGDRNRRFKELLKRGDRIRLAPDLVAALENQGLMGERVAVDGLKYLRLKYEGGTVYYLVNHGSADIDRWIGFSAARQAALFMDPQTGAYGQAPCHMRRGRSGLRVQLRAGEALFVRFPAAVQVEPSGTYPGWRYREALRGEWKLERPWSLSFAEGGPKLPPSRELKELKWWTNLPGEDNNMFSGIGIYETTFTADSLSAEHGYELTLPGLAGSSRVLVNGQDAGLIWSVPYRLDIGPYLQPGQNHIRIEVANLMANRIRTLDRRGVEWKKYHETAFVNIDYRPFDASDWDVEPSGLTGPAVIRIYAYTATPSVQHVGDVGGQEQAIIQRFVVAQDGSGDFKTIQEAVNAVRDHSQVQATILVKNGIYREKLVIPSWKKNILIKGEDRRKTIITNDDYSGKEYPGKDFTGNGQYSTYTSYTLLVQADGCVLENLTVRNTAGPVGQAVALHMEGDRCEVVNCDILGHQDTLYTAKGRQYFRNCFIEGTTDFIFGEATAVFSKCTIRSLRNSYITAASTGKHQAFGYVFFDCKLTAAEGVDHVYLGRPWRPFAKTVFITTEMGKHIAREGWDPWKGDKFFPEKEKTVFYGEYGSWGPGADPEGRVSWSRQLMPAEIQHYVLDTIFSGWRPGSVVRDSAGITGIRDMSFMPEKEFSRMLKSYPGIQLVRGGPHQERITRDITYASRSGTALMADVYRARTDRAASAVLLLFGGGWRSGDKLQLGPLGERLAAEGFTCVAIDYRLSTHAQYPAAVCDVKTALGWMRRRADSLGIDPDRIAVLGFSAGGQLAALVGTTAESTVFGDQCENPGDDRVQAIIDIDGILAFIHPESGEGNDKKTTSAATNWFGYTKFERPDLWRQASALTHVSADTPPTLFINSSVDRMHAGREDFIRALDRHGIYHETRVFADAPHSFCLFEPWFTPMVETVTKFLHKVLRGAPSSTPGID